MFNAFAQEANLARTDKIHAGDAVEQGALASPVGPDQGHDLAGAHAQAYVVVGHQAAKTLEYAFDLEEVSTDRRPGFLRQRLALRGGALLLTGFRRQARADRPETLAGAVR